MANSGLDTSNVWRLLWIAFKLVILSYGKQPMQGAPIFNDWLWIAFKLVILSYGKQQEQ